jgi:hypothetical protein
MYKSFRFWVVILLSISFLSFIPEVHRWWYSQKPYLEKVQMVKTSFQKGMVLPFFALEEDYPYKKSIDEIADLGASSISFFVTNYQEDIRSNYIYLNLRAAEAHQLSEVVDYAHTRGLSVFLFPTLHIQHLGYKEWRGVLKPEDPEVWWQNYFRVIRFYVHFAREHQVEMFSIGSELCASEQDYGHWSEIIQYCRQNYKGILTYSANWDHAHGITFIKDLDFLGMNAYFGLSSKDDPTLEDLLKAWEPARKRIEDAYREYGKPLIFTEIGYPSVDGANRNPWNYVSTSKIDLKEQALCFESFVKTWDPPPVFLHGVYFYNWWGAGGLNDRDYTPRGKPAEKILRAWYGFL